MNKINEIFIFNYSNTFEILSENLIYKEESLFVCLFVLYAFSQTLHGTPLGPGEGQDRVEGTEGEGLVKSPQFSKNGGKFFGVFERCRKCSPISEYLYLGFISSHCFCSRATFQYKTFISGVLSHPIVGSLQ